MGAYVTSQDVARSISADMLIHLTVDAVPLPLDAAADGLVISAVISEAEALVDSYLEPAMVLPLTGPALVRARELALAVARFKLFSRKNEVSRHEDVRHDFERALKELQQISAKRLPLGDTDAPRVTSARIVKQTAATETYDGRRREAFTS
ncbi:MAG: DUF1320 family protein [Deltaproteobacteria bacterium]|nr:DUF1320 family protein [Deltaproteobacteria bacterium]